MNAEKYNLDRIYFGGYFIRGEWLSTSGIRAHADMWSRACGDYQYAVVCYQVLESREEKGTLLAARGFPVSRRSEMSASMR